MTSLRTISIIALAGMLVASCVPARKFRELQADAQNCENVRQSLRIENEKLNVENIELKDKLLRCNRSVDSLRYDSLQLVQEKENLVKENQKLIGQNNDLQESQQSLLRNNSRETTKLLKQLQVTQEELQKKEDELKIKENALNSKENELKEKDLALKDKDAALKDKEKNINALNIEVKNMKKILAQKDSIVNALKNKMNNALTGFDSKDLSVRVQNGKVYVSLEEKLLFKSGSIEVDAKGVEAIKRVSNILEQNPDINVLIEGHTDDVPLHSTSAIKDNWDLSVMRATSIVKIILQNKKIDPKRITAAGRGEFSPIDPAKTPEARAKNRRIEIILTPKLDELFQIIETN
jgi:chemotaxis protein MotB